MKISNEFKSMVQIISILIFLSQISHAGTLNDVYIELEKNGLKQTHSYKKLEYQKNTVLEKAIEEKESKEKDLYELNKKNRLIEEKLIQLQNKLKNKQQLVKKSQLDIDEIIELTISQKNIFQLNGRQLSTWKFMNKPIVTLDKDSFSINSIRQLWINMVNAIANTEKVTLEKGEIIIGDGQVVNDEIYHVGAFSQFSSKYGWIKFEPSRQAWVQIIPQPKIEAKSDTWIIDPLLGAGFQKLSNNPSLVEKYEAAGVIGVLIIVLASIGFIISSIRLWELAKETKSVKKQIKSLNTLSNKNMLGRVLLAVKQSSDDYQQMEDIIDANVSRELPWLNKGIGTLAVLATIAPLMGLLGTVGGMIETFTVISINGVTDSDLLSGGISEALLTTKFGLLAAIPLLIFHCLIKSKSQILSEIIEYQVSSFVVELRYNKEKIC